MNLMKVLLINPPVTVSKKDIPRPFPLLGLAYLASVIKKKGHSVCIIDTFASGFDNVKAFKSRRRYGLSESIIKNKIKKFNPDVIGISFMYTAHKDDAHKIATISKQYNKSIKVIAGGSHASTDPKEVLNNENVDIVVIGEGEETIIELLSAFNSETSLNKISGIAFKKKQKVILNKPRKIIKNLNKLPFPSFELLPLNTYRKIQRFENYNLRSSVIPLITSRGCPESCIFCSTKNVWGTRWTYRSVKNVIQEIRLVTSHLHFKEICFLDDNISINKKRLFNLCDNIQQENKDIKWTVPNGMAIKSFDKYILTKMYKSGCYKIIFALESGNYETLHFIRKMYNFKHAKKIINYANKLGIWTMGTFILGFPYEKKKSMMDTINYAINLNLDFAVFYTATPFPNTDLYNIFIKEKLIFNHDTSIEIGGANSKYFSSTQLNKFRLYAQRRFIKSKLFNPWKIIIKIKTLEHLTFVLRIVFVDFFKIPKIKKILLD